MTVFRYDRSFEGLLTAVFDAYSRRQFPDTLLVDGEPGPLFVDAEHSVFTDVGKSSRVWRALEAKLPPEVRNMLFYSWLSEETDVEMMLFHYIRRALDEPANAAVHTDFSDHNILRVKQLAHKVSDEAERIRQFTRFRKGADSGATENAGFGAGATYFAPVSPRYNALPLSITYFRDRFRDQKWLIYDIKRRYGYYYDIQSVTEITMDDTHFLSGQLDEKMMAEDEKLFQDLWRTYFKSMAIEARINPRLQRQHMPKRFWHLLTEMQ